MYMSGIRGIRIKIYQKYVIYLWTKIIMDGTIFMHKFEKGGKILEKIYAMALECA